MSISKDRLAALIKEAADPNKAPLALQALTDEVGGLIDEHATATATIAERDGTIAQLRDTNMQLFLRQTGNPQGAEPEKEETPDETFDRLFTNAVLKKE
jgi:hypothetical protein